MFILKRFCFSLPRGAAWSKFSARMRLLLLCLLVACLRDQVFSALVQPHRVYLFPHNVNSPLVVRSHLRFSSSHAGASSGFGTSSKQLSTLSRGEKPTRGESFRPKDTSSLWSTVNKDFGQKETDGRQTWSLQSNATQSLVSLDSETLLWLNSDVRESRALKKITSFTVAKHTSSRGSKEQTFDGHVLEAAKLERNTRAVKDLDEREDNENYEKTAKTREMDTAPVDKKRADFDQSSRHQFGSNFESKPNLEVKKSLKGRVVGVNPTGQSINESSVDTPVNSNVFKAVKAVKSPQPEEISGKEQNQLNAETSDSPRTSSSATTVQPNTSDAKGIETNFSQPLRYEKDIIIGKITVTVTLPRSNEVNIRYSITPSKANALIFDHKAIRRKRELNYTVVENANFSLCIDFRITLESPPKREDEIHQGCPHQYFNVIRQGAIQGDRKFDRLPLGVRYGLKYTIYYHDYRKQTLNQDQAVLSSNLLEDIRNKNRHVPPTRNLPYIIIVVVAGIAAFLTIIVAIVIRCKESAMAKRAARKSRRHMFENDSVSTISVGDEVNMANIQFSRAHYLNGGFQNDGQPHRGDEMTKNHSNSTPANDDFTIIKYSLPLSVSKFKHVVEALQKDSNFKLLEEFTRIKELTQRKIVPYASFRTALLPVNRKKNRFSNILPYEHSRVLVSKTEEDESDYINASFIRGVQGRLDYIAAQAPLKSTLYEFWRMIVEHNIHVIVMLNQTFEGRGEKKCEPYWCAEATLKSEQETLQEAERARKITVGPFHIMLKTETNYGDFVIRELQIFSETVQRTIKQLHVPNWTDFECPEDPETLLRLIKATRTAQKESDPTGDSPLLVHCSAGVGRTGTFIAVDRLHRELSTMKPVSIDVFGTLMEMRQFRNHMVQTEDQYSYVYECILRFLEQQQVADTR